METRHLAIVDEEYHPLSLCERLRLGFALTAASVVIEVAERLPRWDRFKLQHEPVRFLKIGPRRLPEKLPDKLPGKLAVVDLRERARAPMQRPRPRPTTGNQLRGRVTI
ncbi:MAG TPA: hypothetical protein VFZ97_16265 [Acidimicrobiales bacterium]